MKTKTPRFSTKSLLAAAALAVVAAPAAKAYDIAGWNPVTPSYLDTNVPVGTDFSGIAWMSLRSSLVDAGVYRGATGTFAWYDNDYYDGDSWEPDFASGSLVTSDVAASFDYQFDAQAPGVPFLAGAFNFNSATNAGESTNIALGQRYVGVQGGLGGDGVAYVGRAINVQERSFQVARTGPGLFGTQAVTAFEFDNGTSSINSVFARGVTTTGTPDFDATPIGSVVRNGNITLGLSQLDGLYAKDAGWLDIKGDLTILNLGTLYIRDGEVTSNVYRNDNLNIGGEGEGEGLYDTRGTLQIDSGILSVRQRFNQDMAVNEGQTLGFRDGAVNSTNFDITGGGYWQPSNVLGGDAAVIRSEFGGNYYDSYDAYQLGEGFFGAGSPHANLFYALVGGGAVRSITGNNVQNGNISIGLVEPTQAGFFFTGEGATFGRINADRYDDGVSEVPVRSTLTINGNVNGVNGTGSSGGALAIFGGDGNVVVNGQVGAGVFAVWKDGLGELVLTSANAYGAFGPATTFVTNGSLRVTHAQALGNGAAMTTAFGLAEFVGTYEGEGAPDRGQRLEGGAIILDPSYSSRSSLTVANDFILGGYGQTNAFSGVGAGQFQAGTGNALLTSSLVNQSGNNTINGDISIGSDILSITGEGEGLYVPEGSILAQNGTTLTINGDVSANPVGEKATNHTLYIGAINQTVGAVETEGKVIVTGGLFDLFEVVKNGNGFASLATVDGSLSEITVNAGKLEILGSFSSTALSPYGSLDKNGAGALDLKGAHHYADVDFLGGTTNLFGALTLQGSSSNGDFDLNNASTLNVESGGSLVHISTDGEGADPYSNGFDIRGASTLRVKAGGSVNLNAAEIDLVDTSSVIVAGTLTTTDAIYSNDTSIITIQTGGVINADIVTEDDVPENKSTITVSGSLNGDIDLNRASTVEVTSGGVITGNIEADDDSIVTLRTGGSIIGNVDTYNDAQFIIETGSTHTGDYNAYGAAEIVVNGIIGEGSLFSQNFRLSGSAVLKGSGEIAGDLQQTGGKVAPGNSPGILTVGGNYTISAGSLDIEIGGTAGAGVNPNGHDLLDVTGTATMSGTSAIAFQSFNSFQSSRGQVFQVLQTSDANATRGVFNTADLTAVNSRVIFDHSSGRAYGTGLTKGAAGQTFAAYGDNANRTDIGRALWMESIAKDNSGSNDNYGTGAITPAEAAANSGQKVFILTTSAPVTGVQQSTGLGRAAVSVLSASDVGAALDALSPEAYAGVTDLGVRVVRGFATMTFDPRRVGVVGSWDFSIGYLNDQVTADATSSYNGYRVRSNQVNVTASRDINQNLRVTLGVGNDTGTVSASGFSADLDSVGGGIGLAYTPDSKSFRFDLGVGLASSEWDSTRQGATAGEDMGLLVAVAARLSLAPITKGNLAVTPYLSLVQTKAEVDGFTESDPTDQTAHLSVDAFERQSLLGELGFDLQYKLGEKTVLTGLVGWQHEFEEDGSTAMGARFADDGVTDTAFSVLSSGFGQDFFRAGLGIRHNLTPASAISVGYNAIFGSEISSGHQFRADYSFRF